jgi:hypothetical protein
VTHSRVFGCLIAVLLAADALAQDTTPVQLNGSFEQFFSSAGFGASHKDRDRFSFLTVSATSGNWRADASYWYYPHCLYYDLDESGLTYQDSDLTVKVGRFRLPVGGSDWYDQWYSGFVQLPLIEYGLYEGFQMLERTHAGLEVESTLGPQKFQAALTSADPAHNRLWPDSIDRISGRYSVYSNGLIVGVSGFVSTDHDRSTAQCMAADVRWTVPNWIFRGEHIWYQSANQQQKGYYVEVSHRPKGWTDVTLVGRYEGIDVSRPTPNRLESWTAGARVRLPWDVTVQANYTGGPDMNRVFMGGAWSFGLYKVIQF